VSRTVARTLNPPRPGNDAAPRSETSKFLPCRSRETRKGECASCQMEDPHAQYPPLCRGAGVSIVDEGFWVTSERRLGCAPTDTSASVISARPETRAPAKRNSLKFLSLLALRARGFGCSRGNERATAAARGPKSAEVIEAPVSVRNERDYSALFSSPRRISSRNERKRAP